MIFSQLQKSAKGSIIRTIMLNIMAAIICVFPEFLMKGIIYVISIYIILNGIIGIMYSLPRRNNSKNILIYLNIFIDILMIACSIFFIIYHHYIVNVLPIFLGLLIIIKSIMYLLLALSIKSKLKYILIILPILIKVGGVIIIIFTFGFGGLFMLSRIFGSILFLSSIYELFIYLIYKKH